VVLEKLKQVKDPAYIKPDQLTAFVAALFKATGMSDRDARGSAEVLVDADLTGIDTHGVSYNIAYHYIPGLTSGYINPKPDVRVVHETPSTATVDADRAVGMVAGLFAMNVAIEKAAKTGAASVAVKNSSHCAHVGYYARMALKRDMIGIALSANGPRVMVPTHGKDPWMGTNPIAFAAPAGKEPPFVLDMATTVVAAGKLAIARAFGVAAPVGWAQDENAAPVTAMVQGTRVHGQPPLGGTHEQGSHKGYGLGLMSDILCAVLPGEAVSGMLPQLPRGGRFCQYYQAIRIDAFRPASEFKADMDEMLRALRRQPSAPGEPPVIYPGIVEHEAYQKRLKSGIPVPKHAIDYFKSIAAELRVPYTLPG